MAVGDELFGVSIEVMVGAAAILLLLVLLIVMLAPLEVAPPLEDDKDVLALPMLALCIGVTPLVPHAEDGPPAEVEAVGGVVSEVIAAVDGGGCRLNGATMACGTFLM